MEANAKQEQGSVWPPAIPVDLPAHATPQGKKHLGLASTWAACLGVSFWLCDIACITLLPESTLNTAGSITLMNLAEVAGPVLTLAGAVLGGLSWRTRRGRFGMILSLLLLIGMGSLIVGTRYTVGHWPWFRLVKINDSCGCS